VAALRIDPDQRFSCSQCGQCCYRWDVVVSDAEIEAYRRHNASSWYRESRDGREGATRDAFEPIPGQAALHRIRKRADGGCGFLSPDNRCRIHQELGADRKPLTCRMYPFSFHAAPDAVVVTTSFGCPTIVANEGAPIATGASFDRLESMRLEWFGTRSPAAPLRELVPGRVIDARSIRILRDSLLAMLTAEPDIRIGIRRIAAALDDLTRSPVLSLADAAFSEYVGLTLPYAARREQAPADRPPTRVGRLLQYGFLYAVAAARLRLERRAHSPLQLRIAAARLLAHFHRVAPGFARIDVSTLSRGSVDLNAPDLRPLVFHYLRASIVSLGGRERALVDDLSMSVSYLNAAVALALMNAAAAGRAVDRPIFSDALMEAVHLWHTDDRGTVGRLLQKMTGGTEALWFLQSENIRS
jgi:Fe-S-cluster containining protein